MTTIPAADDPHPPPRVAPPAYSSDGNTDTNHGNNDNDDDSNQKYHALIVDSGAIIKQTSLSSFASSSSDHALSLLNAAKEYYTVPAVLAEIRDPKSRKHLEEFELRLRSLRDTALRTRTPSREGLAAVSEFARKTGDYPQLSNVDLQVLALTYDLEAEAARFNGRNLDHVRREPKRVLGVKVEALSGDGRRDVKKKTAGCGDSVVGDGSVAGSDSASAFFRGNADGIIDAAHVDLDYGEDDDDDDRVIVDDCGAGSTEERDDSVSGAGSGNPSKPGSWARLVNPQRASAAPPVDYSLSTSNGKGGKTNGDRAKKDAEPEDLDLDLKERATSPKADVVSGQFDDASEDSAEGEDEDDFSDASDGDGELDMERDRQGPDTRWSQSQQTTSDTPPPLDVYQFIWDRTRMIRKDFILQNYIGTGGMCDARAVRCHERIARWHAMCEHQLSHIPDFVSHQSQQNVAELGQTMKTLNNYYDDALGRSLKEEAVVAPAGGVDKQGCGSDVIMGKSPVDFDGAALANTVQAADVSKRIIGINGASSPSRGTAEPEMRGLYILLTLNNEGGMEVLKYSGRLCVQRPIIFYSQPVQLALSIFQAKKDHNYARFFSLLRSSSTPYLFACIMFKYVEDMRKYALTIMSKTYGAKHKTTGEAFYDSYPLGNLVKLLCYEDEDDARTACHHYGITVEGDQVLWRHSKFREPRDPDKGHIIPLKPRKMIRTVESKLHGATRLSVCRGGVSGEGATLSAASSVNNAAAVAIDRQKAQEAAERARKEAMFFEALKQSRAKAQAEELEKERRKQEKVASEKRASAEAARRAEIEKLETERIQRARALAEQRRKEEEARRLAEAKAAAERAERERAEREAQEREEARRRAEEERKERELQRILAKQREEEARRLAEIRAAKEREEKERREEEERRELAELRRKAEEERIRKAKEEEERRIEMMWQQKIEKARKILAWRLWRKQMHKHESCQQSLRCLASLDPTSTTYPTPLEKNAHAFRNDLAITRRDTFDDGLDDKMYRLATTSREPIDLASMVANCLIKSSNHGNIVYHPNLQSSKSIILFKLAVLFPKETPAVERSTLRMWVDSRLRLGHVSSHIFKRRSQRVEVRAVAVFGNEDSAKCKDCNGALFLLPCAGGVSSHNIIEYPEEEVDELLVNNVSRMVLILDDGNNNAMSGMTEAVLDDLVGNMQVSVRQRQGVALSPNVCHFDEAFEKCCETIVMSHFESALHETQVNSHIDPSMVRVSLASVGFLCLQRLIQNLDAGGVLGCPSPLENSIFSLCYKTLNLMVQELSQASDEIQQMMQNWPPLEFQDRNTNSIPMYFEEQYDLPSNWHLPATDLKSKAFDKFHELLEKESFAVFVERFSQKLSSRMRQNLMSMIDNDEILSCFTNVVSLFVNGELGMDAREEEIIYLPIERISHIIERTATFEVPHVPEPVLMAIPSYLYQKSINEEEKENCRCENIKESPTQMDKTANKRKPPEIIEPERPANERVKRIRPSKPQHQETEELRRSKEFTSLLEALL